MPISTTSLVLLSTALAAGLALATATAGLRHDAGRQDSRHDSGHDSGQDSRERDGGNGDPQGEAVIKVVRPEKLIAELHWLAGTWSGDMGDGRFVAYYSTAEGGRVIGHSRLLREGEEAFYEFEMFEARELTLHLQPFPGGRKAGGFRLVHLDPKARRAVFENPDKDFPTRIVYQRVTADNLVITLDDPHGESEKVQRFDLRR